MAQRREQSLAADLDRLRSGQMDAGMLARLQELQHAADADTRLLETYSSRLEDVQAAGSLRASGRRILSPAAIPSAPSAPRKPLIYVGAAALGLLFGLGLSFIIALFRRGIPPAGPGQRRLGAPVLGNMPLLRGRRDWREVACTARDADEPMAQAMRAVRAGLQLCSPEDGPKVVVVTSARRHEGRSTIAAALAVAAARGGLSTVLVDCDLASPATSLAPGWQCPGLADALLGDVDPLTLAQRDPKMGCDVIVAGVERNGGSQILMTDARFKQIVSRLRSQFAYIVLDAPPVLSTPRFAG